MTDLWPLLMIAALIFCCYWFGYRHEKMLWNRGFCPRCNNIWQGFDMDSQGGRGYKCDCKPSRTIWISYSID